MPARHDAHPDPCGGSDDRASSPGARFDRWSTVRVERRVLGVVRTLTTVDRLRDVFSFLVDDFRVETRFTVADGSHFAHDLHRYLERSQLRTIPWHEATFEHFDFAVSPSGNGDLHEIKIPLFMLSHGACFNKYLPDESGMTGDVAGLSRAQLLHGDQVIPRILGLSHEEQLNLLQDHCPEALAQASVIGDPSFDRLRASLPMRNQYRNELATGDRRLVLLASTWGQRSLFGQHPHLARRLISTLPSDSYQVALVLHPNVWSEHSPKQIKDWTTSARAHGLLLVPPEHGWQAVLTAADVVISDHGSLGFYAAALGKPLLLGAFGDAEVVPGSPAALLGERADRWRAERADHVQIDNARPVPGHELLAQRASAHPDRAGQRLREVVYDQLDLALPPWDAVTFPAETFTPRS